MLPAKKKVAKQEIYWAPFKKTTSKAAAKAATKALNATKTTWEAMGLVNSKARAKAEEKSALTSAREDEKALSLFMSKET